MNSSTQKRAQDLVLKMMAIPGPSGEEGRIARFILRELKRAGAPATALRFDGAHRRSPRGGQVGNLILRLPGTVRAPRRLLMAHIDTVPICVGSRPVRRGRRIVSADPRTGLGGDNRAGAAAVLVAALDILRSRAPHPPLTFAWTVQEEVGLIGARQLSPGKLGHPRLGFNFDGGSPEALVIGATGAMRLTIRVHGIAAHAGAHPERGVSAIAVAARAIADLERNGWHGLVRRGNRRGTSNVGVIQAGAATNVVTEFATLRAEARSHSPAFRRRIVEAYRKAFARAARAIASDGGRRARIEFDVARDYESFVLAKSEPCVAVAAGAVTAAGLTPVHRIVDGGLDANWMNAHGVPTVSLGTGQQDIHTVKESLIIRDFHRGCRIALALARGNGEPRPQKKRRTRG